MIGFKKVNNILTIKIIFLLIFLTSCQTIKNKTDKIIEKENAKLSEYIGETLSNLQTDLGKPDEDFKNEKGNLEIVYNTKKYGIVCERRFELDSNSIVIGFVSKLVLDKEELCHPSFTVSTSTSSWRSCLPWA